MLFGNCRSMLKFQTCASSCLNALATEKTPKPGGGVSVPPAVYGTLMGAVRPLVLRFQNGVNCVGELKRPRVKNG